MAELSVNKVKALLTKKIGPFPAWVWLGGAGAGLLIARKFNAGGSNNDFSTEFYDDEGGYPYAANSMLGGGGGGFGTPASAPPDPTLPYLPEPALDEELPGTGGPYPSTTNAQVPGSPGNCPPGYYWNGHACLLKVVAGPAKVQPGATPGGGHGLPRKCPKAWHWNGFDCVPDYLAPSKKSLVAALRAKGLRTN